MVKVHSCLLVLICYLGLAGCASAPEIHSTSEPGVDFTQYQTYAFLTGHQPEGEQYTSIADKHIKNAIAQELASRGITPSDNPDLLIGFKTNTQEKISTRNVSTAPSMYYGYRGYYGYSVGANFGTQTEVHQYTEGTLNVDVVDKARKQLIWEGVAVGRLKSKAPDNLEEVINTTVRGIFTEYPIHPKQ